MLLGELLVFEGLASQADIDAALVRQDRFGGRIGENLIAMGIITREALEGALRKQYRLAREILTAEDLLEKSKRIHGNSHPRTHRQRLRLAVALSTVGRLVEALDVAQTALAGHERALGADHPWTRDSARAVAHLLAALQPAAAADDAVPVDDGKASPPRHAAAQPSPRGWQPAASIPPLLRPAIPGLHGASRSPTM